MGSCELFTSQVLPALVWKLLGEGLNDLHWLIAHLLSQSPWSKKHEVLYLAQLWSHATPVAREDEGCPQMEKRVKEGFLTRINSFLNSFSFFPVCVKYQ